MASIKKLAFLEVVLLAFGWVLAQLKRHSMGSEDSSDSFRMREKPCEWIKINHDKTNGDKIMADLRLG